MKFKLFLLFLLAITLSGCSGSDNVRESESEAVTVSDTSNATNDTASSSDEENTPALKNFADLVKEIEEGEPVPVEEETSPYELMSSLIAGNFAYDSSFLDQVAQELLDKHIEFLRENPEARAEVQGHCDERGSTSYNIALGERRAKAAYQYMVLSGISSDRLSTVSFGSLRPLASCHNESCWSKNRRVQMRYYK